MIQYIQILLVLLIDNTLFLKLQYAGESIVTAEVIIGNNESRKYAYTRLVPLEM